MYTNPCRSRLAGDSGGSDDECVGLTDAIASKPAPHGDWVHTVKIVGASLLAMDVNDDVGCLNERGGLAFFASKLAPTGNRVRLLPSTAHFWQSRCVLQSLRPCWSASRSGWRAMRRGLLRLHLDEGTTFVGRMKKPGE
jgi:hypothetical protein